MNKKVKPEEDNTYQNLLKENVVPLGGVKTIEEEPMLKFPKFIRTYVRYESPSSKFAKIPMCAQLLKKEYLDALYLVDLAFSVSFLSLPRVGYTY